MRLYSFEAEGQRRLGADLRGQLVDLTVAYSARASVKGVSPGAAPELPRNLDALLGMGTPGWLAVQETLHFMGRRPALPVGERAIFAFDEATLLTPVARPGKILCASASEPIWSKASSALLGAGGEILCPAAAEGLDLRVCLASVMGAEGVAGYTMLLDVRRRDRVAVQDPFLCRNGDTFCPLGPALVLLEERPGDLTFRFRCEVNGQSAGAAQVRVPPPELSDAIARVAQSMTLQPGDIIAWVVMSPSNVLRPGDVLRVGVEEIGALQHRVARRKE